MTIMQKANYLIDELGVRQQFICDKIGMGKSSFSEFVNGKRWIKPVNKAKLEVLVSKYNIVEIWLEQ